VTAARRGKADRTICSIDIFSALIEQEEIETTGLWEKAPNYLCCFCFLLVKLTFVTAYG